MLIKDIINETTSSGGIATVAQPMTKKVIKRAGPVEKGKIKIGKGIYDEGKSPHKKGTKKYKKHMAAKHANMNEANFIDVSKLELEDYHGETIEDYGEVQNPKANANFFKKQIKQYPQVMDISDEYGDIPGFEFHKYIDNSGKVASTGSNPAVMDFLHTFKSNDSEFIGFELLQNNAVLYDKAPGRNSPIKVYKIPYTLQQDNMYHFIRNIMGS